MDHETGARQLSCVARKVTDCLSSLAHTDMRGLFWGWCEGLAVPWQRMRALPCSNTRLTCNCKRPIPTPGLGIMRIRSSKETMQRIPIESQLLRENFSIGSRMM